MVTYKKKTCIGVVAPFATGPWSFDAIVLVDLEMYDGKGLTEASALLVVWAREGASNCLFAQTGLLGDGTGCLLWMLEAKA